LKGLRILALIERIWEYTVAYSVTR